MPIMYYDTPCLIFNQETCMPTIGREHRVGHLISRLILLGSSEAHRDMKKPMEGMVRCDANYVPLSPISFLERSAVVYGERISVVYGDVKYTWRQTRDRCVRLASALSESGVSRGDVVSVDLSAYSIPLRESNVTGFSS
ncbi:hypothetical protein SAY87_004977 [Trapa incisa]|uniref:AMP-dependent synthetase/ligase domain-containing protein n=1 Tax=Trapa incisa TaxID=236973 RepID=A0AAN7JQ51_9MYRT|nr:hypothetical protein SAY87_004977 [Trapa incisa]